MRVFEFDNTYAKELDGFYAALTPEPFPAPRLLAFNEALAEELGLDASRLRDEAAAVFGGVAVPEGADPLAQAYAGHQFGHLSPQLGDGRAMLLGEVVDTHGQRRDIHLKGSGRTAFSRGGDGRATIGPVLREYIVGEAMHHLGIPTTRALAAVATGETVYRETELEGAILARVASSHLRVGTFQYFAVRKDIDKLRRLTDYTVARHYPQHTDAENPALELLREVIRAKAKLVSMWMQVGFVHGVMNTDNTTISGETIDYGPCAFMEAFDPRTVFSSIDHHGRYAYGNQPTIGQWNVARFAEALLPLLADNQESAVALAEAELDAYPGLFRAHWLSGMRRKLGLGDEREEDEQLIQDLLERMHRHEVDYTLGFRRLSSTLRGDPLPIQASFGPDADIDTWVKQWRQRLESEDAPPNDVADAIDRVNPLYIARNHKVEEALASAITGDLDPFRDLVDVLSDPFTQRPGAEPYAESAPPTFGPYTTFCGT